VENQVQNIVSTHGSDNTDSSKSNTIFHQILDSKLPDPEKTVARLTDEGFVMVVAGGETTSKVLTVLLYFLLANPEWLGKVREELDNAMPNPKLLSSWQKLEALPCLVRLPDMLSDQLLMRYQSASIKESLRLSSAVTNRLQMIDPIQPTILGGWAIPPGTPMSTSIPFILRDPTIFPSPEVWNPARWIRSSTNPPDSVSHLEHYLTPFSKGPRSCLGVNLAYAEIYHASAAMLRRFDMQIFDTLRERDVDVCRDCFVGLPQKGSQGVRVKILGKRN
jgi:cytochrome P450